MRTANLGVIALLVIAASASVAVAQPDAVPPLPGVASSAGPPGLAPPGLAPPPLTPPSLTPPSLTPRSSDRVDSRRPPSPRPRRWYGSKTLAVDLASFALIVVGVGGESEGLGITGMLGLWLGTPLVHAIHGNPGRGVASFLLLRPGLVMVGAKLGSELERCGPDEWFCGLGGALAGGLVGIVVASVADAALSYETVRITPIVQSESRTLGLGLTGSF
jgi:hypothetical protein